MNSKLVLALCAISLVAVPGCGKKEEKTEKKMTKKGNMQKTHTKKMKNSSK